MTNKNDLYSPAEAARLIGYSPSYLRLLADTKRIKCKRVGKLRFFRRKDLDEFLQSRNQEKVLSEIQ